MKRENFKEMVAYDFSNLGLRKNTTAIYHSCDDEEECHKCDCNTGDSASSCDSSCNAQ